MIEIGPISIVSSFWNQWVFAFKTHKCPLSMVGNDGGKDWTKFCRRAFPGNLVDSCYLLSCCYLWEMTIEMMGPNERDFSYFDYKFFVSWNISKNWNGLPTVSVLKIIEIGGHLNCFNNFDARRTEIHEIIESGPIFKYFNCWNQWVFSSKIHKGSISMVGNDGGEAWTKFCRRAVPGTFGCLMWFALLLRMGNHNKEDWTKFCCASGGHFNYLKYSGHKKFNSWNNWNPAYLCEFGTANIRFGGAF